MSSRSSSSGIFIPIAIGLVGVILGGVALFIAFSGSGKTAEAQATLTATSEQTAAMEARLSAVEAGLAELNEKIDGQETRLRTMASQTQGVLNQVGQEINATRQQVSEMGQKVQQAVEKLSAQQAAPAAQSRTSVASATGLNPELAGNSAAPAGEEPPQRVHTIAPGDTFARLASRYKVSVDQILAANPDADPRRLQIGQKITIPHGSHSNE